MRGPSGRGASRAEEKGASRLARAGVLEPYVEHGKQAQRSHGARIACFGRRVVSNAGYSNRKPRPTVFHESRDTKHGFFSNHRLDSLPTIAHHCPLLPGIARGKILPCASVLAPPGRCFPARCGAARAAMARHGRPPSPAPATRPVRFSRITRHESRNMVFPCPSGDFKESNPKPNQPVFSRITRHGYSLARGASQREFQGFHETRITAFFESRPLCFPTHHFPQFPGISRHYSAPPPPQPIKGSPAVHRSGQASGRAPFAAAPAALRAASRCGER